MESNNERRKARYSLIYRANGVLGICEQLRLIYDEVHEIKDKEKRERMTELLVDAFIMGKKIVDRLAYYKKTYNDETGHNGKNLQHIVKNSRLDKIRRQRKI